jgi:hypothetical protein
VSDVEFCAVGVPFGAPVGIVNRQFRPCAFTSSIQFSTNTRSPWEAYASHRPSGEMLGEVSANSAATRASRWGWQGGTSAVKKMWLMIWCHHLLSLKLIPGERVDVLH